MRTTTIVRALALTSVALAVACGKSEPAGPRVFFAQPQDGATVTSPVHLEFAVQDFKIEPVPKGTVVTDTRPNLGHHHVGVDTDCLPVGTVIPMAAPWVHFGTGGTSIDMQLPPGPHRLTLQIGDDLHRTMEGLCQTISVTVSG